MIPIKETKPPKIRVGATRIIKPSDEKFDMFRRLTCDLYIACQNMVVSHDMYRRATLGAEYVEIASANSTASVFFSKPENVNYMAVRRAEIAKAGFDEFCKMKNIEHSEFKAIEDKEYDLLVNQTPAEIREKNYIELEKLKKTTDEPQILAQIIKQQSELFDAKLKDKGVELAETEKLIHFYLPAAVCDTCPNKKQIEEQFKNLPDIDLEIE